MKTNRYLLSIVLIVFLAGTASLALAAPAALSLVWQFTGGDTGDDVGYAVSTTGDVNGDGYADVIVGAPKDTGDLYKEGLVYVFHGGPAGLNSSPNWQAGSGNKGAGFGSAVSTAGDVDGDGYADIIVGAPEYKSDEFQVGAVGAVFVYRGSATGLSAGPSWQLIGQEKDGELGISVSSGDFNGDSYSDVLVGSGTAGTANEGAAFVFYGSATGLSSVYSQTFTGTQASAKFGYAVSSAGDVNGDGFDDVVIGAPQYDNGEVPDTGAIFVFFGSDIGLSTASWHFTGTQPAAQLGAAVSSEDVNGDSYADIIAGAPRCPVTEVESGAVLIFHGSAAGLPDTPQQQLSNGGTNVGFGIAVNTAGDVDNDGYNDVIVGAYRYTDDQSEEGTAFIYFGGPSGLASTPGWHAEGNKAETQFGYSVSTAGDVDNDGYADVIIGAPEYRIETDLRGRAFVYLGAEQTSNEGTNQVYLPLILKGNW